MKKERIFYLDMIRSLSLIFVIIFHYNIHLRWNNISGGNVFNIVSNEYLGPIGVSLFLIISGAALMYSYQTDLYILDFFKRRFWTIYPVFWTGFIIAFLFTFYMNKTINHDASNWTIILTILGIDGYTNRIVPNFFLVGEWFLGFILQFYLIFPILRRFVIKKPKAFLIVIFTLYVLSIMFNEQWYGLVGYPSLLSRLPEFVFGMYFIYYIKNVKTFQFICAVFVVMSLIVGSFDIGSIMVTTLLGMGTFILFVYLAQKVKNGKVKTIFSFISKYSFTSIIANQLTMVYVIRNFGGQTLSIYEIYILFSVVFIVILLVAVGISKLSSKIVLFFAYRDS